VGGGILKFNANVIRKYVFPPSLRDVAVTTEEEFDKLNEIPSSDCEADGEV
jgi:hypothetical protein